MSFVFFKQKTADEMRISDWSSDVCSSDLTGAPHIPHSLFPIPAFRFTSIVGKKLVAMRIEQFQRAAAAAGDAGQRVLGDLHVQAGFLAQQAVHVAQQRAAAGEHDAQSSEEHTSELQSLMRISYAAFGLK